MPNDPSEIIIATYDAEESLVGAILLMSCGADGSRECINQIALSLQPCDFRDEQNRFIFEAMIKCPLPPHEINTARQLLADKHLDGNIISHMMHCISVTPHAQDFMDYAQAVKRYSELRNGIKHTSIRGAE
jgi:replicative DNA helicase